MSSLLFQEILNLVYSNNFYLNDFIKNHVIYLIVFIDRYVILGNHRDAWALGAMDPSSGTAVLLEVTRIFSQLYKEGILTLIN